MPFSTIPVEPMMIGITSTFLLHILWHSIWRSTYLLSGLLLDVVVTWDSHINYQTPFWVFLLYYNVWLVAWDVPICFDLVVPQDGCLLILHYSFLIVLVPVLCTHFDSIVLTYIQMQLGSCC